MALLENQLYIKISGLPNAGLGLFTKQPILKNTIIVEYKGRVSAWKDVKDAKDFNGYVFYITRNTVIDAKRTKSALARYANDAQGLSRVKGISNNAVYDVKGKKAYIKTTKNIPAGGEILVAYGKEYWDTVKENIKIEKAEQKAKR
jgi:SET domain-containing protein